MQALNVYGCAFYNSIILFRDVLSEEKKVPLRCLYIGISLQRGHNTDDVRVNNRLRESLKMFTLRPFFS